MASGYLRTSPSSSSSNDGRADPSTRQRRTSYPDKSQAPSVPPSPNSAFITLTFFGRQTPEQRDQIRQFLVWSRRGQQGQESCLVKTTLAGAMGLALGGFFSLMSSSFVYEDPLRRSPGFDAMPFQGKARVMFREMGRGMWSTGKGFGKVGALYSGLECCVEGVRPLLLPRE